MGNVIKQQLQGLSWWVKTSLVLLLTLAITTFMSDGLYKPQGAEASVVSLNAWPPTPQIVSNTSAGTVTGTVTVTAGANRIMLVAVGAEYTAVPANQPMTVTFGGRPVQQLASNIGATGTIWLGYVSEADLAAAVGTTLSVTNANTTNLTAMYASAAVFSGVSQTTPISGVSSVFSNSAVTTMNLPAINVKGAAGNTALSFYITNRNGQVSTVDPAYTKNQDYAGTNFNMSFNTITTAPAALISSAPAATTATASSGSAVVVGLVPTGIAGGFGVITTCGGCHFYPGTSNAVQDGTARNTPPSEFPGSHTLHVTNYAYVCTQCHYNNTDHNHSTGFKNITGSSLPGNSYSAPGGKRIATTNTPTFGSCGNIYCHSSGTGATGQVGDNRALGAPVTALTWGAASTCSSCHTGGTTTGPTYPNTTKANSHAVHTAAGVAYTCDVCHFATTSNGTTITTAANHVNKVYNVSANTAKTGAFTYTYASTGGTCSNTMCHGSRTVTWGSTLAGTTAGCDKCHSSAAAATFVLTDGTSAIPKATIHVSHMNLTHNLTTSANMACSKCHSVPASAGAAGHIDSALPAEVVTSNSLPGGGPFSMSYTGTYPTGTCTNYCHGATLATNNPTPPAGVVVPTFGTTFLTGVASNDCGKCHGYPPLAISDHAGKGPTDCKTCHPHVNAAGNGFDTPALHIDGKVDAQGGDCTGCHASIQGGRRVAIMGQFTGSRNSHHYQGTAKLDKTVCYACHWEADATGAKTAHHQEQTAGFKNKVQLVNWSSATTRPTTYNATTYVLYSSGGKTNSTRIELAKINRHCLGCHNERNKNTAPFANDTFTPSKYSWEALTTTKGGLGIAAQSIASKYSDLTTTLWGKFTGNYTNAKSSQTKALSAHGNASANQRGWSTLAENAQGAAVANYPNTSGTGSVLCFDCHNSHGSASSQPANAVTTSYSSATGKGRGGILKNTVAGLGGYAASYRPYTGGNAAQKNAYKTGAGLCFDCHNNSAAGATTSTGNVSPWGYGTFGATQIIHGYNDNPYFGKVGGAFPKGQTYAYIGTGRPNNMGGHFGASSALTTATVNNMKIGGLCTPCHDPHGVSQGILAANRQYAVPMLKETFVTSPYKQDAASVSENHGGGRNVPSYTTAARAGYHIDQNTFQAGTAGKPATALKWNFATTGASLNTLTDTQFAGLCMKCHAKTSLQNTAPASSTNWKTMTRIHNSVEGWATTGGGNAANARHAYTCSKCHSTHNSNLPRLLVTNCLDATHKGRMTSGGATGLGPYATSGQRGNGGGRFPGGGGAGSSNGRDVAPGPWFFGTSGTAATQNCHDSATAGGTTFNQTSQQWNTKTLW